MTHVDRVFITRPANMLQKKTLHYEHNDKRNCHLIKREGEKPGSNWIYRKALFVVWLYRQQPEEPE